MKIFISWSGETSREIGEAFRNWLPDVLQFVQPYFTPNDIEKGQRWSAEIAANLEASKFGLMCITAENLLSPWLMFEAGAISKSTTSSRVCPLLFGVEPSQLTGPLLQFQATAFSKEEVLKFLLSINESHANPLTEPGLKRAFDRWWPELEEKIDAILNNPKNRIKAPNRTQIDMVEEILSHVRLLSNKPDGELANQWNIIFKNSLDFGEKYLKISKSSTPAKEVEKLRLLVVYLKSIFNISHPKMVTSANSVSLTNNALKLLQDIEKYASEIDDDIPF